MNELFVELGQYLRLKRKSAALSQNQVAKELGYSTPQFISNFERGLCAPPLDKLRILIGLYRLDQEEVLQLMIRSQEKYWRRKLVENDDDSSPSTEHSPEM